VHSPSSELGPPSNKPRAPSKTLGLPPSKHRAPPKKLGACPGTSQGQPNNRTPTAASHHPRPKPNPTHEPNHRTPASPFVPRCGRAEKAGRLGTPLFEARGLVCLKQLSPSSHGGQSRCKTSTCWLPSGGLRRIRPTSLMRAGWFICS